MIPLSTLDISLFGYLGPLGYLQLKNTWCNINFMEMSGIHWETMFDPYIYTDSGSLVTVP